MSSARNIYTEADAVEPFRLWQQAAAALKAAKGRGAPHAEIAALSAEVIRTRNAVTVERMQSSRQAPDDILSRLTADDHVLDGGHDTPAAR